MKTKVKQTLEKIGLDRVGVKNLTFKKLRIPLVVLLVVLTVVFWPRNSSEISKAKDFIAVGMYEQAVPLLQLEIQANPKNAEANYLLGKCYMNWSTKKIDNRYAAEENQNKIEKLFNRAVLLDPDYGKIIGNTYLDEQFDMIINNQNWYFSPNDMYSYDREMIENNLKGMLKRGLKYNKSGKKYFSDKLFKYAVKQSEFETNPDKILGLFYVVSIEQPLLKEKISDKTFDLAKMMIDKGFVKEGLEYAEFSSKLDPAHLKEIIAMKARYKED